MRIESAMKVVGAVKNAKAFALMLFPLMFVTTIPVTTTAPDLLKGNALNEIFANHGYQWFTVVYFALFALEVENCRRSQAGATWKSASRRLSLQYVVRYVINTIVFVALNISFFGNSIFERITLHTIHCHDGADCDSGFDPSGHYYFLSSISLLVLFSLSDNLGYRSVPLTDVEYGSLRTDEVESRQFHIVKIFVQVAAFCLVVIWIVLFFITSIFFHTFYEKIVGLACGLSLPLMIYFGYV